MYLYSDGASRGNPGPAAAGAVLKDASGNILAEVSRYLGIATNNQAEYEALIAGLEAARRLRAAVVEANMDSELVVLHLAGRYRVKHPGLKPLFEKAKSLMSQFDRVNVIYVPGTSNHQAHMLAKSAFKKSAIGGG